MFLAFFRKLSKEEKKEKKNVLATCNVIFQHGRTAELRNNSVFFWFVRQTSFSSHVHN